VSQDPPHIRVVRPEDAEQIVAIFNPIIESGLYTIFDSPFSVEEEREFIHRFPARGIFHVATLPTQNRILGFQSMEPFASFSRAFDHVGVIGTYVDLSLRRQGVASALFKATFEAAKNKGYQKLFTYIRADNPAALATYQAQGFRVVGKAEKHVLIRGRFIDEIMIEKFL
jgi:L-amino acid N-acyltransferase YncA